MSRSRSGPWTDAPAALRPEPVDDASHPARDHMETHHDHRYGDQHRRPHQALSGRPGPDGPDLDVPAGSIYGFLGPNGAGQVDHPQDPRRPHPADRRLGVRERHPARGRRRVPPAGRLPRPGAPVLRLDDRSRDARVRRVALAGSDRPSPRPGSTRSSARSASPTPATAGRRPTRAGCASGSASARRWSDGRGSSSSTSRSARSTRSAGARSSTSCATSGARHDGLLLDPHPRRRPAGERPRRDPRPGSPGPRGADRRAARDVHPRPPAGRDRRRHRRHRDRPGAACPASSPSRPTSATATCAPTTSGSTPRTPAASSAR